MPREVLVEYTKAGPKQGRQYAVKSAAQAKKKHPEATIVAFHPSGEPYNEKSDTKAAEKAANPAAAEVAATKKVGDK